jgi:hypothetical protein
LNIDHNVEDQISERGEHRNHTRKIQPHISFIFIYSENTVQAFTRTQITPESNAVNASVFHGAREIYMRDTAVIVNQYPGKQQCNEKNKA